MVLTTEWPKLKMDIQDAGHFDVSLRDSLPPQRCSLQPFVPEDFFVQIVLQMSRLCRHTFLSELSCCSAVYLIGF